MARERAIGLPVVSKFDDRGIRDAKTGLDRLGGFAKGAGLVLAGAFAGLAAGAGAFAASSVRAADESFRIGKGLENAIKNAGIFGSTDTEIGKATKALQDHSTALQQLTGIDDEVLDGMKRTFLAVPDLAALGTDGLNRLAEVAADVAAGTGRDIEGIGNAFIKIAGDEESALSKLSRMGIVFTDEQKNTYQALLDSNDQVGAQAYLIDQLASTYDGAAESMASPLGRIQGLFENLQETVGTALMPALEELVPILATAIAEMVADPEFQAFLEGLTDAFIDMIPQLEEMLPSFLELVQTVLPLMVQQLPKTLKLLELMIPLFEALAWVIRTLSDYWGGLLSVFDIINGEFKIFNDTLSQGIDPARAFRDLIKDLPTPFQEVMKFAYNAGVEIRNLINTIRDFLGLPALSVNTHSGAVSVQDYVSGGLKLAAGGIVLPRPGGTMATIGEGGSAEAVIPLDRLDRMMNGGGGGATYVVNVNGGLSTSADIGRAVVDAIKRFERSSGPVFASA